MISIEDCAALARRDLEVYVHGDERLIQAARGDNVDGLEAVIKKRDQRKRKD